MQSTEADLGENTCVNSHLAWETRKHTPNGNHLSVTPAIVPDLSSPRLHIVLTFLECHFHHVAKKGITLHATQSSLLTALFLFSGCIFFTGLTTDVDCFPNLIISLSKALSIYLFREINGHFRNISRSSTCVLKHYELNLASNIAGSWQRFDCDPTLSTRQILTRRYRTVEHDNVTNQYNRQKLRPSVFCY